MSTTEPEAITEKQQRVLDAAMEAFAERGYAGTSTAEIAKRAGVAEGTVFKTYKTKKDLLIAVVAPFFARVMAPFVIEEVLVIVREPHARFEDFLRALYKNRIEFIRSHERLVRIAVQELPFHPEVRALAKKTIAARVLPDVTAAVKRFQKMGEIREAPPASIIRIVVGTFLTYVLARTVILSELSWDDDAEIELMVATLAKGLKP